MAHTNWYRYGTISINQNSNHVIGLNTRWADIGIKSGDIFTLDGLKIYEVDTVTDNANLTLKTAFEESSAADVHYCIIRNFTDISTADIVAQMSELQVEMKNYIDTEMSTLKGKSAYELAQDNGFTGTEPEWLASLNAYGVAKKGGYTGTESEWLESLNAYGIAKKNGYTGTLAEWLESLKAAGEWSSADSRIAALEAKLAYFPDMQPAFARHYHNIYPRFKDLGTTITAAQYAALENGSYDDLFVGDYWRLTVNGSEMWAIIVQLGGIGGRLDSEETASKYRQFAHGNHHKGAHIMLSTGRYGYHMNDTNTTEGGYKASKMHTEILPELASQLAAAIGSEHILNVYREMSTSNTVDASGNPTKENIESKLELPEVHNIRFTDYITNNPGGVPWALFQLPILNTNTPLYNRASPRLDTWLRDVANNYHSGAGFLYSQTTNIFSYQSAGFNWHQIAPHFVLVP